MSNKILPAIIAKNQKELDKLLKKIKGVNLVQLDVMDGIFVKNKSLLFEAKLRKDLQYEMHLMVEKPLDFIKLNKNNKNIKRFLIQVESKFRIDSILKHIPKSKLGISVNPETPLEKYEKYLDKISKIQFMTVTPGKYGSQFKPGVIFTIADFKKQHKVLIGVDGGINNENLNVLKQVGVKEFVVGSYLFKGIFSKRLKKLESL